MRGVARRLPGRYELHSEPLAAQPEELDGRLVHGRAGARVPGHVVESARVMDVITGTSTKIRVALEHNAAGREHGLPPTLIVKGGFEPHSVHMGFMYASEMRFYRDLLPRCR